METVTRLQDLRRRDRLLALVSTIALAALAWAYLLHLGAAGMSGAAMSMPQMTHWGPIDFVLMFVMWAIMMVAMMLPSATPVIMIFGKTCERRRSAGRVYAPTMLFVAGYLAAWTGFSLAATLLNWVLHSNNLMSSMMGHASPMIGGGLLVAAGLFQWTPLKQACLEHCRSPVGFLASNWREGRNGAFAMGLHHGAYCLGCCWMLMLLLFTLGVMNLAWVAALTIVVLAEKLLPAGGAWPSRLLGGLLVLWGAGLIVSG